MAAVLNGAPIMTFDLDILHSRQPENIARLIDALRDLGAHYRNDSRRLTPNESHLSGPRHLAVLPTLRATLQEQKKHRNDP